MRGESGQARSVLSALAPDGSPVGDAPTSSPVRQCKTTTTADDAVIGGIWESQCEAQLRELGLQSVPIIFKLASELDIKPHI